MYLVFYKTTDVFSAEEILKQHSIPVDISPTPVQDKAYCGVCVEINNSDKEKTMTILQNFDYDIVK